MNRDMVVEYLNNSSECELLSIIQSISKETRHLSVDGSQLRVVKSYLLATAIFDVVDEKVEIKPDFIFLAEPKDGTIWPGSACEAGTCPGCKTDVAGFSSASICPVCGHVVSLT